jgi:hypothetical protein
METKSKNIFQLIPEAIGKIGAIPKNQKNAEQNYMFRGIDDFMNACNKVFSEIGIFCIPEVLEDKEIFGTTKNGTQYKEVLLKMKYTFYASDGSSVSATVKGEARDYGDKATNKALSAAMKYALMQVFCITTKDNADSDKETAQPEPPKVLTDSEKIATIPATLAKIKTLNQLNTFYARCKDLIVGIGLHEKVKINEAFDVKAKEFGALWSGSQNKFATEDEI